VHKSGLIEELHAVNGLALPQTHYSAEGHRISLTYASVGSGGRRLESVIDGQGETLLQVKATGQQIEVLLRPDGTPNGALARFVMKLRNSGPGDEVYEVVLPSEDQASWRFTYRAVNGLHCIAEVKTPVGGHETIEYDGIGHQIPGNARPPLPRVWKHTSRPGFGQPALEVRYDYANSNLPGSTHNFLGNNTSISWSDDGQDNLYKVLERYRYGTTETHYADGEAVRSIERTFNRFHLLSEEKTTQGDKVHQVFTAYYADDKLDTLFSGQDPQCQLPKRVETRWSVQGGTSRSETVLSLFDTHGNLTEQVQANGVKETSRYFPVAGIEGECPPDPQGFVRTLRDKTVTPAPDRERGAPVLRTHHRYALMPPVAGAAAGEDWLVLTDETLCTVNGTQEELLQHSAYTTFNAPADALLHGRRQQQAVTLNGLTTTTDYAYRTLASAFAGETVLQTVETLTGFDHGVDGQHTQKVVTLEHSLVHGEPLLTRDDNDVEIRYSYDALLRVTRETVAPDTTYAASRSYRYHLTRADGQQASQEATDVKGVQTRSLFDGLNRVILEQRQDTDHRSGARAEEFRDIYRARYNALGQLAEETEYDWCSADAADDLVLVSQYRYDDWGEQRSVIRPDGVEEHEVSDPVRQTVTSWIEGMGKSVTRNNLFEKPDSVTRYALGDDPNDPRVEPISEHTYVYDGLGRTARETNALQHTTAYEYDAFERMLKSTMPDQTVVERRYALHSTEDLPVWIGVNDRELGQQAFDGLDRMHTSITGGRVTTYRFNPGQSQPCKVIRPSLEQIDYDYLPALGEDPLKRTLASPGTAATYDYDEKNARLRSSEENGLTLSREYFSTGEIKSETRQEGAGGALTMFYDYSRQARLLTYTDVLEQVQSYNYDKRSGQLMSTRLGTTAATFAYNAQGQTERIATTDGAQSLTTTLTYDDQGREILREFDFGGGRIQRLSQVYNEGDLLVQRTLTEGDTLLRDETYGYDNRGRLEEYNCSGTQPPLDPYDKLIESQVFFFDELDNLTRVDTYSPEGRNRARYAYDNEKDPAQLTSVTHTLNYEDENIPETITLDYDADGNLLHDEAGRTLGYDELGRLISVSSGDGGPSQYRYDPLDTLAGQDGGSGGQERRFYADGKLANQIQAGNSSTFMRGEGVVLAEHQAGVGPKSLLMASDEKNSVLLELSQEGRNAIAYSAYGHCSADAPVSGHLSYNGERRETQTGWYLLGNGYRAFNPALMRFHSPDSWSPFGAGGVNAYMYCLGNPISFDDSEGHSIFSKLTLFFMDSASGIGGRASQVGRAATGGVNRSADLSRVTSNMADLNVGARPSRSAMRGGSTNSRPRTPTPDYNSGIADAPQMAGPSHTDAVQTLADRQSAKIARDTEREARKLDKINRRIERHTNEYKIALSKSKPNNLVGTKDAFGNKHRTTGKMISHNSYFNLPEYQVTADTKDYVKRVREYQ
jgi:RHS repeat-associated protein